MIENDNKRIWKYINKKKGRKIKIKIKISKLDYDNSVINGDMNVD